MDVFVWLSNAQNITKFQIAYDKPHAEKSFTWTKEGGEQGKTVNHVTIDEGKQPGRHPATPILNNEVTLDRDKLVRLIEAQQDSLPANVYEFIKDKLCRFTT